MLILAIGLGITCSIIWVAQEQFFWVKISRFVGHFKVCCVKFFFTQTDGPRT